MIELQINIEVALKSGAKIILNQNQTESVKSYVTKLITGNAESKELLPSIAELAAAKPRAKRRYTAHRVRGFTDYENQKVLEIMNNPAFQTSRQKHNPARVAAIKQLAKELNRSTYSIMSRMWKIQHGEVAKKSTRPSNSLPIRVAV